MIFGAIWNIAMPIGLPIGLVWGSFWLSARRKPLFDIIKDGQLFLGCAVLTAVTSSDLESRSNNVRDSDKISGQAWFTFLLIVFAISVVAYVTAETVSEPIPEEVKKNVGIASVVSLALTAVAVIWCRWQLGLNG